MSRADNRLLLNGGQVPRGRHPLQNNDTVALSIGKLTMP